MRHNHFSSSSYQGGFACPQFVLCCYYSFPWIFGLATVVFLGFFCALVVYMLYLSNFSVTKLLGEFNFIIILIVVGITFVLFLAISVAIFALLCWGKRKLKITYRGSGRSEPLFPGYVQLEKGIQQSKKKTQAEALVATSPNRNFDIKISMGANGITIAEQIGSGSFATVFKGQWLDTPVAIKRTFLQDGPKQREIIQRFKEESALMSALKHPNIVLFLGTFVEWPYLYLITEFCDKGSLHSILHEKKQLYDDKYLSIARRVQFCLDAARGVLYLHSAHPPIIHRDIKCANLLVNEHWVVKVADFGMSRIVNLAQSAPMTACGTLSTTAPEVLMQTRYSEKADVYSFGCVMWEILARQMLYVDLNVYELTNRVVHQGYRPPIPERDARFPDPMIELMRQCWRHNPDERPSFREIVPIISNFLQQIQNPVYQDLKGIPMQTRRNSDPYQELLLHSPSEFSHFTEHTIVQNNRSRLGTYNG